MSVGQSRRRFFYDTDPEAMRRRICACLESAPDPGELGIIRALLVPARPVGEAEPVVGAAYRAVEGEPYENIVLVASSAVGAFQRISITEDEVYETPLGAIPIDDVLRNELCDEDDDIFLSRQGHEHNFGIEAQLPFLQCALSHPFSLVPIVMGWETWDFCRELGSALGEVLSVRNALLIAPVEIQSATPEALQELVRLLEGMEPERLSAFLHAQKVGIQGVGPVLVSYLAALELGANQARVLALRRQSNGSAALAVAIYRAS